MNTDVPDLIKRHEKVLAALNDAKASAAHIYTPLEISFFNQMSGMADEVKAELEGLKDAVEALGGSHE